MTKINIVELLKNCPKGMELYSPIFGDVYLDETRPSLSEIVKTSVVVRTSDKQKEEFLYDGRFGINGECMLFPSKENRDWSTFQKPFKDGDILFVKSAYNWILIYKESKDKEDLYKYAGISDHPIHNYIVHGDCPLCCKKDVSEIRFATEEEKEKLFKAIKDNGYQWNSETKTLEKLIKPKFKVGDRIKYRNGETVHRVVRITEDTYVLDNLCSIPISIEHMYNLVHNKFDITTLKPFDNCKYSLDKGRTWKFAQYWYIQDNHNVNDIEIELWQN